MVDIDVLLVFLFKLDFFVEGASGKNISTHNCYSARLHAQVVMEHTGFMPNDIVSGKPKDLLCLAFND